MVRGVANSPSLLARCLGRNLFIGAIILAAVSCGGGSGAVKPSEPPVDTPIEPPPDPPEPPDTVQEFCEDWKQLESHAFHYLNNVWGKGNITNYEQCLLRRAVDGDTRYGWRWRWPSGGNLVKAFPEVIYGHKPWHPSSTTAALPRKVSDIGDLSVDYDVKMEAEGSYNLAFIMYGTSSETPTPGTITHEIMVWVGDRSRAWEPQSSYYKREDDVAVDGARYALYINPYANWLDEGPPTFKFIAFNSHSAQLNGTLDLKSFIDYLIEIGELTAETHISSVELGNEIENGTGEVWLDRFRVDVGSSRSSARPTRAAVERSSATPLVDRVNEVLLPEVARAASASARDVIARRIEQARRLRSSGAAAAGTLDLAGSSTIVDALSSNAQALGGGSFDLERTLMKSSFTLPVDGMDAERSGALDGLVLWGSGDYRTLSDDGALAWEGDMTSAHLGADARLGEEWLAGLSLSWSRGSFTFEDRAHNDMAASGEHESRLTSLNPYVGWTTPGGVGLWATLGVGWGEAEIDGATANPISSDLTQRALSMGANATVLEYTGSGWSGTTRVRVKGQGSLARLEIDSSGSMAGLRVATRQMRLMLESSHERPLASGALIPSFEMGVRHDGGDGTTGTGVETGGGLRYEDPVRGLTVEGRARVLLGGAHEEWGMGGRVQLGPGARGHGLSFSLAPRWGETAARVGRLWEQGVVGSAVDDGTPGAPRVAAQIGYGIGAVGGRGVLTPYVGLELSGDASRLRGGGRLEVAPSFDLILDGERRETGDETPEHAVMLRSRLRF